MTAMYSKSPLNYIGGKYKMLPKLLPLFPTHINTFYDLFAGGCDVCTNVTANTKFANDINFHVINVYKEFQQRSIENILSTIDNYISEYHLTKQNIEGFLALRKYYNECNPSERNPIMLFTLVCYSFNYQYRFNSSHEFNGSFGRGRSSFNDTIRKNLVAFHEKIKDIHFLSKDFTDINLTWLGINDFLYADPPYKISTGVYNDGKRGFKGWSTYEDLRLFSILDVLNNKGVKFALSNVIEHKGMKNAELIQWMAKYNVHYMDYNYKNSNYHAKNTDLPTIEVLITNY